MISFVPWILLGAWQIAVPIDGLNDQNAAAFRERIVEYFKTRTDDAGQPITVQVHTRNSLATITVDCPVAAVAMSELNNALKDSPFSLKLDKGDGGHWMLLGRAAFRWRSGETLSEEKVRALRTLLKDIGLDTGSIDVVSTWRKCHAQNTLRIVLGPDPSVPAFKVVEILEREGHRNPDLVWEKGDRTRCGACRYGPPQPVLSEAPQGRVEGSKPRTIDPRDFLSKAVLEGLKEDGADQTFVTECVIGKGELFVLKCRICDAVRYGFAEYAKGPAADGKGIPKDIVDELKHAARPAKLNALERLVDRYVSRHYERLKVTVDERLPLQAKLEEWKKEGMKMKEWGSPNFGDSCPSCNAAAKQR